MTLVDVRGQVCPYPTSRTMAALRTLAVGESVEVISDYYPARTTIPALATLPTFSCELEEIDERTFRFRITREQ